MSGRHPVYLLAIVLAFTLVGHATAGVQQIPVVRLTVQTQVAAPPAAVWSYITTGKNLVTWCPMWKDAKNSKVNLSKVGDSLDFMDQWGNGGRSVVTYIDPNKELRIAHEPQDGSYVCQAKLILEPSGDGTIVHYVEQYTDESSPEDLKATAAKMEAEMQETLAAVKKGAEK
jgi:uncharacterized protein YndB with AHSA1/START domain